MKQILEHSPFTSLEVSNGRRSLHVMPCTLHCSDSAHICVVEFLHVCQLHCVVVMTGALFMRSLLVEFVKECLVLRFLNKICISFIQAWVNEVVRSLLSLQAEISIKPNKEPVEPTMKINS